MALTNIQKEQIRLMVALKASAEYMAQIAASDEFALSELEKFLSLVIARCQKQRLYFQERITNLDHQLAILQARD